MVSEAVKVGHISDNSREGLSDTRLPKGVNAVYKYSLNVTITKDHERKGQVEKKKGYLIEIHDYHGYALLKYYPRHLKDNPNKFKMRSNDLGYELTVAQVRALFWECAKLMKKYLDEFPNNFIGFIGQPDDKDDHHKRRREVAQRASIYNRYVDSLFRRPKYATSSPEIFREINLRLIRRVLDKKTPLQLDENQNNNYELFLKNLEESAHLFPELMTEVTRRKAYQELEEIK